jgi:phosphohistidine phosphatase
VIYLLRHGDAERGDGEDAARRLTAEGERQSVVAGRALAALGAEIDACLTSPKVRAADTARLACEALPVEPEVADELAGGFDALALSAGRGNAILVGHNPHFKDELARLTGAKAKIRKGGLAIVEGDGTLLALLRPEDLAALAGG